MSIRKFSKSLATVSSVAILAMTSIHSAIAAPGSLTRAPLFLSTIVEPNVFFTLDDSGSMDYELMVEDIRYDRTDGTHTRNIKSSGGLPLDKGGDRIGYLYDGWPSYLYTGRSFLPPANGTKSGNPDYWDDYWVYRTHHGNKLYYNPDITYKPWSGTDAGGNALYPQADPTAARKDPDTAGTSVDLTNTYKFGNKNNALYIPTYYIWKDDGDSVLEIGDDKTQVEIKPSQLTYTAGTVADPIVRTYVEELQNFANWFVYYRSRINATKAAIGGVISKADATRMGLDLFNGGHNTDLISMKDSTVRLNFLKKFYAINIPASGTPGRTAMKRVGDYFEKSTSGAILDSKDGGECQQNFNIFISDGFWSGTASPGVKNADTDGKFGNSGVENNGFDGDVTESVDNGYYEDEWSNTLADVAMHYYERDLNDKMANKVPTTAGVDENNSQHLVTYTISFGLEGSLDPKKVSPLNSGFKWPDPADDDSYKIDDLWHAAYNGRGKYLSANNANELEKALDEAILDIAERTATAAAVSINSAKLTTESVVYLAQFNTNRWQGNITAFKIADTATGALATTADWDAASRLDALGDPNASREIFTYDGSSGIPFAWNSLNTAQKSDLKTNAAGGVDSDDVGIARLEYLRGSRDNEGVGNAFRNRVTLLGDIVNSGPVFVGAPNLRWPDVAPFPTGPTTRYSNFKNGSAKNRDGVIYAGSNDGMLHGFAENGGAEVMAYIPHNLFSSDSNEGLHYLTDPGYVHKYYNDLTPTVSDVYINSDWRTVLISGQRGGGRGIYALDVTDPSKFTEANAGDIALWEFTHPDLGFTYSKPQIGMMNSKEWVAIFGNGYNDTGDGKAKLFIVKIQPSANGSWTLGSNYRVITTGSGDAGDRNGLATPALADLDGNGTIDRAYAGDLRGQMWAFDLSSDLSSGWNIVNGTGADPLFTTNKAVPTDLYGQPITARPTLARHPNIFTSNTNEPNVMVFFGSGQYLVDADKTTKTDNHFYGVLDKGIDGLNSGSLVEQTYDSNFNARVLTRNSVNYLGGQFGWYFKLDDGDDKGERSVTQPVVRGDIVFFNTFVPNSDPCSVGGYGFRFAVDLLTGGSPENSVVDVNQDGVVDEKDQITSNGITDSVAAIRQEGFLPEPVFIEDIAYTADTPSKVEKLRSLPKGRFSWQELIQ